MSFEAVGAAAIVVVLWLVREVAGFLLKAKLDKHKETLTKGMNRKLLVVLWDLIATGYTVWFGFYLFNNNAAATRRDLLVACGLTLFVLAAVANLIDDLRQWARSIAKGKTV